MAKLIFVSIVFLLFIWRIQAGYRNGVMREVVNILSGIISMASVMLLFFAISSYREKAMSVFALCVVGLIALGVVFKVCRLICRPLLAFGDISVISGVNKIFGAAMGAVEALALSCLFYYIYEYILDHIGIGVL